MKLMICRCQIILIDHTENEHNYTPDRSERRSNLAIKSREKWTDNRYEDRATPPTVLRSPSSLPACHFISTQHSSADWLLYLATRVFGLGREFGTLPPPSVQGRVFYGVITPADVRDQSAVYARAGVESEIERVVRFASPKKSSDITRARL